MFSRFLVCLAVICSIFLGVPSHSAEAASITVTTTDDELNNDGDCSLREAIQAANTNIAVDACPAGEDTNTDAITLVNGTTYTITLAGANEDANATGDFDILDNSASVDLIISIASGQNSTINGNALDRIFHIHANASVTIGGADNLTLTNGQADDGGAIYNSGNLILTGMDISSSQASTDGGGIYNQGTMFAEFTYFHLNTATQNGGGLYNAGGTVNLDVFSVFSRNTAVDGAGIYNTGVITLHSTILLGDDATPIEGNSASGAGGAIYNTGTLTDNGLTAVVFLWSNSAGTNGAGIYNTGVVSLDTEFNATFFIANISGGTGGAIYNTNNTLNAVSITGSCFVDNSDIAFDNATAASQNATGNYWGTDDGPSGVGPGNGDSVSANVDYSDFLTSNPNNDCPIRSNATATPTNTSIPPTFTPSETSIPPTATDTSIPPTFTPSESPVPPTNTDTSIPPTFTPSESPIPPTNTATTCAISVTAPNLISPVHRAHTTDTTPTFTWGSVSGAQSYRLMVYTEDRSFEYKKRVFVPTYTLKASEAVTSAKYLWRVRTQDTACSTWSQWSGRFTLFVD